ncbi:MAG: GNAT family N-acetyltransferase [Oscillospiraceae bacterium]|jgi:ribosomal protein S18 acetylase RimI-like enzyme|nr:GNAT family N-acetyltransferase [Oscillospiraceae bacterium]
MTIRKMTIDDYDAVYALWLATPGMGLNTTDDSREGIEKYLRRNPTTCLVAEENGELIGVSLGGHDGRRGFLNHAAVKASERRRGIGELLLERTMDALRDEGISKVALVCFKDNEIGNAFCEKHGFVVRHELNYRNRSIVDITYIRP